MRRCAILGPGMITLHQNAALIECADDLALDELMAATPLPAHVIRQLSSRAVIVDPEYVEPVIQAMIQKGYTPRVTG
jgi:hypothetical protein